MQYPLEFELHLKQIDASDQIVLDDFVESDDFVETHGRVSLP